MKAIGPSLLNAQKQIKNALKDAKNPHFRSDYATLESVIDATKEIANECGLVIIQGTGRDEQGDYVNTTILHAESGESITSKLYLHLDKPTMQAQGSAISYARRYLLASMFCITQADDDANEATKPQPKVSAPQKPIEQRLKEYRVNFGKSHVGKAIHEIPIKDLEGIITWYEKQGKLSGPAVEFVELASYYCNGISE